MHGLALLLFQMPISHKYAILLMLLVLVFLETKILLYHGSTPSQKRTKAKIAIYYNVSINAALYVGIMSCHFQ